MQISLDNVTVSRDEERVLEAVLEDPSNSDTIHVSSCTLWTLSSSRYSLSETPGEKPASSRVARVVGTALKPAGFCPGVSQRELGDL
jgi:hypothetical protein